MKTLDDLVSDRRLNLSHELQSIVNETRAKIRAAFDE